MPLRCSRHCASVGHRSHRPVFFVVPAMSAPKAKRDICYDLPADVPTSKAARVTASASSHEAVQSSTPHDLDTAAAKFSEPYVDAIAVHQVDDLAEAVEKWAYKEDRVWLKWLELVPGRYWRVSDNFNNHPAYKKELVNWDDATVFIVHSEKFRGWVWTLCVDAPTDSTVIAWAPATQFMPNTMHFPFWCKAKSSLLLVKAQHAYAEEQCMRLESEVELMTAEMDMLQNYASGALLHSINSSIVARPL